MKELSDEDIQRLLETGSIIEPSNDDVQLYKTVFNGLATYPHLTINGLSESVVSIIQYKKEWQSFFMSIAISLLILVVTVTSFFLVAANINAVLVSKVLLLLNAYKWVFMLVVLLLTSIQILDKRLLIKNHKSIYNYRNARQIKTSI